MSDWFKNMPALGPNSIAPAPYKPPVFWTLCLIAATAISAVMFVCALIWLILSPIMPPTGMP